LESYNKDLPIKSKAIKASELETDILCIICKKNHKKKDCWMTNCHHEFGAECLKSDPNLVYCPICKSQITKIISYRSWSKHTQKITDDDILLNVELIELSIINNFFISPLLINIYLRKIL
jgi:hypothetical protein